MKLLLSCMSYMIMVISKIDKGKTMTCIVLSLSHPPFHPFHYYNLASFLQLFLLHIIRSLCLWGLIFISVKGVCSFFIQCVLNFFLTKTCKASFGSQSTKTQAIWAPWPLPCFGSPRLKMACGNLKQLMAYGTQSD